MEGLAQRTAHAARWRLSGSVVAAVLQFAVGVLLARLLTPADFGLVALTAIVLGLAQPLGDLGIGSALVQRTSVTERHVRTAFTLAVLAGFAMAGAIALAAPLAAAALGHADVTPVLRGLSAVFALRALGVVADALLRRQLDFRRPFFIETGSHFVGYGGVAVAMALLGYGVWSLVWGGLLQALLTATGQWLAVRHSVRPLLAGREIGDLLHVGTGAALSRWVNYLALNGDYFVVGRWMGAASLGLYTRAYTLMSLPFTYAAGAMTGALFPAFSQVQDDAARLRRGFLLATRITAMIAAPAMGTLAIAAPHLVPSLYGPDWAGAVAPLQILCIAGYFRALYHLGGVVLQSVGRVYGELSLQAVYAALVVGGSLTAWRYGLTGVAVAVGAAIAYMFIATATLVLRATGMTWRLYLRAQLGAILTAAATCAFALSARMALEAQQLPSGIITAGILVAAAAPWSAGVFWSLDEPDFEPLQPLLPNWCRGWARLFVAKRQDGVDPAGAMRRDQAGCPGHGAQ